VRGRRRPVGKFFSKGTKVYTIFCPKTVIIGIALYSRQGRSGFAETAAGGMKK
jgi:hypothetical protein